MLLWFQKHKQNLLVLFTSMIMMSAAYSVNAEIAKPDVPKGKGEQCVEPTDFMRKNHMEVMLHQRDETMHRGIRTNKHSLKECISCHVQPDSKGQVARYGDNKHFCSSCHTYAAVNIDCFECHADRPQELINMSKKIEPKHSVELAKANINKNDLQVIANPSYQDLGK